MPHQIPPSYRKLLRYGRHKQCTCDRVKGIEIYEGEIIPGTAGKQCHYDPGLALTLTQVLVRQGYDPGSITTAHMDPDNMGFFWVRRQSDPGAASLSLIAGVDHERKPMLDMETRHARIFEYLSTGVVASQTQLALYVGTARDSDVFGDIDALAAYGAITVELVPHGKVPWKRIYLSVTADEFWKISKKIRSDLAAKIAAKEAIRKTRGKGFKSISVGNTGDTSPHNEIQVNRTNGGAFFNFGRRESEEAKEEPPLTFDEMLRIVNED